MTTCNGCLHSEICLEQYKGLNQEMMFKECKRFANKVDVVKVVRCKDCKHCEIFYPRKAKGEEPEIVHYCNALECLTKSTDFCSCGELKERESSG